MAFGLKGSGMGMPVKGVPTDEARAMLSGLSGKPVPTKKAPKPKSLAKC